ncbi:hypothetical protein [Sphingomonas sp. KR3-1]|uniref:hypothetical protein n=1 Tax=Sphingomonas sp. KR3-1 TaxID=3156611 RepID=UPI0032B52973
MPTDIFAQRLPAVAYMDLNVAFHLADTRGKPEFYVNVQDLLNTSPPAFAAGTAPGQSYAFSDDPIARCITVGFYLRF